MCRVYRCNLSKLDTCWCNEISYIKCVWLLQKQCGVTASSTWFYSLTLFRNMKMWHLSVFSLLAWYFFSFFPPKCGQLFLDMLQKQYYFRQQENKYLQNIMFCHRSIRHIVFFKRVFNKACCFSQSCKRFFSVFQVQWLVCSTVVSKWVLLNELSIFWQLREYRMSAW